MLLLLGGALQVSKIYKYLKVFYGVAPVLVSTQKIHPILTTSVPRQIRTCLIRDAQLSQRDRAAGCVIVFAKSSRIELGDNILRTLQAYLQPL